ncbi:PREDICTED: pentatricopeptide repeat-containing protein At1g76280 isoform X2 [Nicotiana attenuata]|uniref:Pentatricopeptide repeat-containing protein n=1 Tax=Nicotiana attenuata TaxID=49451 RepID=A0A1J6JYE9_NICAT|nr:PREDICTED: pentatricopeptide repeat-containing protein At1g76280 isoform X2 [Nicotiana attenuata]OIT22794.1 pentatricopeptide repeat-containing protein [Nicotiana attenuata]
MPKLLSKVRASSIVQTLLNDIRNGGKEIGGFSQAMRTFTTSSGHVEEPVSGLGQKQIVDALVFGERSRAVSLLYDFSLGNNKLSASDFASILQTCARLPDPLFVMETWKIMEEKGINISAKCYFLAVRALCKGGYLKEALSLMSIMEENPNSYSMLPVYNNFLVACSETHAVDYANECMGLMEHQMVGKNEITYAQLLKLAVLQQNLSAVHEIWKECSKYYSLSVISLRKFIWSFTELRDLQSAYTTLQHMVSLVVRENSYISRTAEGRFCDLRLDIPAPSTGNLSFIDASLNTEGSTSFDLERQSIGSIEISTVKKPLSASVTKLLRWSFNDVMHACAKVQNCDLAEQLMLQMQTLGLQPSGSTYDGFIRAIVTARGFSDGVEVLKVMQEKNIKPHDSTLAVLAVICSRELQLDRAEAFLDEIAEIRSPRPYNAFLEACDVLDQPERAVQILAKMKKLNLQPNIRTYELLFSLFGNVNAPYEEGNMLSQADVAKRINAIEMDMMKYGLQHSHLSLKNVLKALGTEGMIKELIQYLHAAENRFSRYDTYMITPVYNTVLHSLVEAKESQMATQIFKSMVSSGVPPDAATYNIMIDRCSIIGCFRSALALISMMLRNGFNPQAVTLTGLLKILLRSEDFDGSLKLLKQGISEGIQVDVLLYNTILQVASEKGRIDVIELIVEQMHVHGVLPDPSTCRHVFAAYVDHGFYNTAMEALQVLSVRMIAGCDNIEDDKQTELENLILGEDLEDESQILEPFKDSKEYLTVALLQLRWCAILGYPVSWSPSESQWARRLSNNLASMSGSSL